MNGTYQPAETSFHCYFFCSTSLHFAERHLDITIQVHYRDKQFENWVIFGGNKKKEVHVNEKELQMNTRVDNEREQ